jgi:hypothetical protein
MCLRAAVQPAETNCYLATFTWRDLEQALALLRLRAFDEAA